MSRHELVPLDQDGTIASVAIGWDRPLQTFFLQVHGRGGNVIEWRGTRIGAVPAAAPLIARAARYASVPVELEQILEADRRATEDEADGPAITMLKVAGIVR